MGAALTVHTAITDILNTTAGLKFEVGTVQVPGGSADTPKQATFNFTAGFTQRPRVFVTGLTGGPYTYFRAASVVSVDANSCTIAATRSDTEGQWVDWLAIGN